MAHLYELQDNLVKIDEILENNTNSETQEILESAKEELLKEIDGKIEGILDYIDDCKAKCQQLKENEERLAKKRKTLENKTDYLRGLLLWFMKTNDKTKESFGNWNITVAKTAGRVVVDTDIDKFPIWLIKTTYTVDKDAVKKAMLEGKCIIKDEEGKETLLAHLEIGESLRIA